MLRKSKIGKSITFEKYVDSIKYTCTPTKKRMSNTYHLQTTKASFRQKHTEYVGKSMKDTELEKRDDIENSYATIHTFYHKSKTPNTEGVTKQTHVAKNIILIHDLYIHGSPS